jgi:primosomal protein N''
MDEAEAVLTRLERIERLDRRRAPAAELLAELRLLVREAEAWAARERDPAAEEAVERCRDALSTPV